MTCIVGLIDKENNKVYIGGDSAGANSDYTLQIRKDPKVFINGNFLIGFTTSFRMGQLLMFNKLVDRNQYNESDYEYLVQEFIPTIKKIFKDEGFSEIKENKEKGGNFLVAYKNNLYVIESNYQVIELYDNYYAIGCGGNYALGSLHTTKDMNMLLTDRIINALEAAEHHSAGVKAPFNILSI